MKFVNRILGAVLSLALMIGAALVVIEVVAAQLGLGPALVRWPAAYTWASSTRWQDTVIRQIGIGCVLVGVVLLVAELRRRRVDRLSVTDSPDGVDTAFTRKGVARAVQAAVGAVDGIREVSVGVRRRSVHVAATATARHDEPASTLREPVEQAARERLEQLQLRSAPRVKLNVRGRS